MDPVTLIVIALATGAAAGLQDSAARAVRQAYSALTSALKRKYPRVDARPVEQLPASAGERNSLAQSLRDAGGENDRELLDMARALFSAVEEHDPGAAAGIGIDLERIRAAFISIEDVTSAGTGVRLRDAAVEDGITIKSVRSGGGPPPN